METLEDPDATELEAVPVALEDPGALPMEEARLALGTALLLSVPDATEPVTEPLLSLALAEPDALVLDGLALAAGAAEPCEARKRGRRRVSAKVARIVSKELVGELRMF